MNQKFALLFFLVSTYVSAQQLPPILGGEPLKKGVYRTYSEFIHNAPSITENFEIRAKSRQQQIEKGVGDYRLVMLDSAYSRRDAKKFWGACDGENVFVNEAMNKMAFNLKRIEGRGRYCYYKGTNPEQTGAMAMGALAGGVIGGALAGSATHSDVYHIININNGKIFQLTKANLKMILQQDRALFDDYQNDKRPGSQETMLLYIKQYNEKHLSEAFFDRTIYSQVKVYRRAKKEVETSFTVTVNDTLDLQMDLNTIYSFATPDDSVTLCFQTKCARIPVVRKRVTYVHCIWREDSDPVIEHVDPKEGQFYANEVKTLMDRRKSVK